MTLVGVFPDDAPFVIVMKAVKLLFREETELELAEIEVTELPG